MKIFNNFVGGDIKVPISKSYAHRYIFLTAMYYLQKFKKKEDYVNEVKIEIDGFDLCDDIISTLNCVEVLGVENKLLTDENLSKNYIVLKPNSEKLEKISKNNERFEFKVGESGTTLRFLLAAILILNLNSYVVGEGTLVSRKISEYIDILKYNNISYEYNGKLPIVINKRKDDSDIKLFVRGNQSSQLLSGFLIAAAYIGKSVVIHMKNELQSKSYVDMTIDALDKFGISVEQSNDEYGLKSQDYVISENLSIEADYSSAAFFIAAGILRGNIRLHGLSENSAQGDKKLISILKSCGANLYFKNSVLYVEKSNLASIDVDVSDIPDLVPIMSVIFSFASGKTTFKKVSRLALKESNRIESTLQMLQRIGGNASYDKIKDNIYIEGIEKFKIAKVKTYDDHRIAMSASIAATASEAYLEIDNYECAYKSYRNFYYDLEKIGAFFQY